MCLLGEPYSERRVPEDTFVFSGLLLLELLLLPEPLHEQLTILPAVLTALLLVTLLHQHAMLLHVLHQRHAAAGILQRRTSSCMA